MNKTLLNRIVNVLFGLLCIAYPIAVIGMAFDVHPPFSMTWAGTALLILEGTLLTVAIMDEYGPRGLLACLVIAVLAYAVETLSVTTGFPFGPYRYTDVLSLHLPGGVPLAVVFAWLMITLAVHSLVVRPPLLAGGRLSVSIVISALFATLLDLVLEPVAFHVENYWRWLAPGHINYYGVPWVNFIAWFGVALVILTVVTRILLGVPTYQNMTSFTTRIPLNVATWLYFANVFMFGLVDLTHGFYLAAGIALFAFILPLILLPLVLAPSPYNPILAVMPVDGIEQDQAFQPQRKRVKKGKRKRR